jgi:hypothetical protein
MSVANHTTRLPGPGEERTVRIVPASSAPRAPQDIKAASSVFAVGQAAKPPKVQRKPLDVNTIEVNTGVPLPPNTRSGPSKYAALLQRMPPGSMVELPDKQAGSLASQAKKAGVRCAVRKLSPTTRGVWRLA